MDKILQKYFIKKADEKEKLPTYIGIFLDKESQEELFKNATLEDRDPDKSAHHITIVAPGKVTPAIVKEYIEKGLLGKEVSFDVTKVIQGEVLSTKDNKSEGKIESALVKNLSEDLPIYNDSYLHVTLSRDNDAIGPMHAGKISKPTSEVETVLKLKGYIGFFYGVHHIAYSQKGINNKTHAEDFQKVSGYKKLIICDFDDTLFNSPKPPGGSGWGNTKTLEVSSFLNGEKDVENGFNKTVLNKMQQYSSEPTTYTVLLTGRQPTFRKLIQKIIQGKVKFDEMLFSDGSTLPFKKERIENLINKLAGLTEVEVWEDRDGSPDEEGKPSENHLKEFITLVAGKGLKVTSGEFAIRQGGSVKLKPEIKAELEAKAREAAENAAAAAAAKARKEQEAANRAIPVAYATLPETADIGSGIKYSDVTVADPGTINGARAKFFKDPMYEDLKLVIINLPPSETLDLFKDGIIPNKYCVVFNRSKKKPEAA